MPPDNTDRPDNTVLRRIGFTALGAALLLVLYSLSRYHFLLFHSLIEIYSVVIGCMIFVLTWNTRRFIQSGFLVILGIAFLFIGVLDLFHTLSYQGIGIFPQSDGNRPTQFWIAARYMEAISFLIAAGLIGRSLRFARVFLSYTLVTLALLAVIFFTDLFPDCYLEGTGLTPFKKVSEIVIIILIAVATVWFLRQREAFDSDVRRLIVGSLVVTMASEAMFTLYVDLYGLTITVGHLLKLISVYLLYQAIVGNGINRPLKLLFRDLSQQQAALKESEEELLLKSRIESVFLTTPDDRIFYETLKLLLEVLKSRYGFFGYIDRNGDMVSPTLTRDIWQACEMEQKSIVFKKEDWTGLWGRSLRERCSLIQNGDLRVPKGHVEIQNALVVPIIHNRELIGQLALANRSGGFGTAEQQTVEKIAEYIAPILRIRLQRDEEIRQREATEKALRRAKEDAEVANQAKSRFIAGMSHEFRTPLNIVIGFADVLKEQHHGPLNDKQREYLDYILESGTHLSFMIDEILDICNIEAGRMKLEPTAVSIRRLLERSAELHKEEAARHNLTVDIDLPQTLADRSIVADEVKLKQIMFNLLSNAIKFTPDGGHITLSATQSEDELIISVADTGIGIEPKDQETIFEGFYQLKDSDTDKTPGTGLGLNLAKRLVEIHRGRIWAESEGLGRGSFFRFTIPLNPTVPEAPESSSR